MINYVIPNTDGEITAWGVLANTSDAPAGAIAAVGHPSTHYVKDGEVVEYTELERLNKADRKFGHVWSNQSMSWVDTRSIEDIKIEKWTEIKAAREQAEYGGFTYYGMTFDSDAYSQSKIQGAAQLALIAGESFSTDWTLADDSIVSLTKTQMLDIGLALGAHVQICHAKARMLREMIDAAETAEELEAITWENFNETTTTGD